MNCQILSKCPYTTSTDFLCLLIGLTLRYNIIYNNKKLKSGPIVMDPLKAFDSLCCSCWVTLVGHVYSMTYFPIVKNFFLLYFHNTICFTVSGTSVTFFRVNGYFSCARTQSG